MPRQPAASVMTALGFPRSVDRLHQRLLGQSGRPLAEVAAALLTEPEELRKSLRPLLEAGIVRLEPGPDGEKVHVDSLAVVVARMLAETAAQAARGAARLQEVAAAVPFLAATGGPIPGAAHDVLPLEGEVQTGGDIMAVVTELVASSQGDLLWLRPDQFRMPREQSMVGMVAQAIADGRRSRALYPVRALAEARDILTTRIEAGEEVRLLPELPTRMAVFGRNHALLPEPLGFSEDPRLLISQRGVVAALGLWFDCLWERAEPVTALGRPGRQPELRRLLLEQLASGAQDAQIARRLGLSLRTVRRRVAELLTELGAESRFQAGVEAARRGWL